jgi:uncharacterized membrane protein
MISEPIAIFFILAFLVVLAIWLEKRSKILKKLGSAALVILLGMLLSNVGVIPGDSTVYDFLMGPGVSSAIVLILLSVDIKSVRKAGPEMLKAFGLGAVGSVLGSMVMALILAKAIGPETWKLAGQFTGTYIGGGVNFTALGVEFQTTSDLFSAGIAADVIVTAMWLVACLTVPLLFKRNRELVEEVVGKPDLIETSTLEKVLYQSRSSIHILQLAILIAITLGSIWLAGILASTFSFFPEIFWLTTIVLLIAQVPAIKTIPGGAMMGNYLLLLFLASNGAKSVIANIVSVGPEVFYYALGTIFIHGIIIFGLGSLLKIDAGTLAVASQANVGGSSSAMAMASARGYSDRILPGIAVGLLGYAVGNYLGLAVASLMQGLL